MQLTIDSNDKMALAINLDEGRLIRWPPCCRQTMPIDSTLKSSLFRNMVLPPTARLEPLLPLDLDVAGSLRLSSSEQSL